MNKALTLKGSIGTAISSGIRVFGDLSFRGDCPKEDTDLIGFFSWVRYHYPEYSCNIFHVANEFNPNEKKSSFGFHSSSLAKGRVNGICDVICIPISEEHSSFCCELKRRDISKSLSSKKRKEHFNLQVEILKKQMIFGNYCCIALGLDAIKKAFIDYVSKE